ncbi:MAG TPA: ATP-binding cassette domain-containing protein, partial [Candidatus Omnitrophota bacterium]|nr:ATP-binding cassette domain-containing protein [Candidatus Omnitrophota bacterium]
MIELINLCKAFDDNVVLDNVNLTIEDGETIVIIGRSGTGKSVMLKHIIGLMKPDSGQVIIDGQDVTRLGGKELNELRLKFG